MDEQKRGQLTSVVKDASKELLGYEIDETELRLIPYVHFVMTNEQKLDQKKITQGERDILSKWRKLGYIEGGASGLSITREFYDIMNEILFVAYVDLS